MVLIVFQSGKLKYNHPYDIILYLLSKKCMANESFFTVYDTFLYWVRTRTINSLRPRQNRRHFVDNVFKCNFLNENVWIPIKISPKFVPKVPINNIPALVQIMAWCQTGDKPLSEPMMTQFNDAYMRHLASTSYCYNMLRSGNTYLHQWNGSWLWLVTCSVPQHYLNQCLCIADWISVKNLSWHSVKIEN